jgi:hypothetical protein
MIEPIPPDHPIIGTWRLTRFTEADQETGAITHPMGPRPRAYVIYTSQGYVSTIFAAAERQTPASERATEQEAVALYRSMVAFAGRYRLEGDKLIYHPEVSWNEAWNGTTQERRFNVEADRLEVTSVPAVSALTGTNTVFSLIWERAR